MLPTTGFFKNIECPFHESNCERPYCHFRHRKKPSSEAKEPPQPSTSSSLVPTYNPTPKSQLANTRNSHIPISYVPDLAGLPRERPFRFNNNSVKPVYKPTPLSVLSSGKDSETPVPLEYSVGEASPDVELDFEDLTNEFDLIDQLIDESEACDTRSKPPNKCTKPDGVVKSDNEVKPPNECDSQPETGSKRKTNEAEYEHNKRLKLHSDKVNKQNHSDTKRKTKSQSQTDSLFNKHCDSETTPQHKKHAEESSNQQKKKSVSDSESHSKSKLSTSHKHKSSKSDSGKSKSKSESKSSSKTSKKSRKSSGSESDSKKSKKKHHSESKSHKKAVDDTKRKTSSSHSKHSKSSDSKKRSRSRDRHKSSKRKHESTSDHDKPKKSHKPTDVKPVISEPIIKDDSDSISDNDTMQECYKIFTEYKPTEPQINFNALAAQPTVETDPVYISSRKRVAHEHASQPKLTYVKPKAYVSPAQIMVNRYKQIAPFQIDEQREIMEEMSKSTHLTTTKKVEDINGRAAKRRIAPVLNAGLIQQAKAQIDALKARNAATTTKTQVQTVLKGAKRVAHIPEHVANVPSVLDVERSKLPVNVRTRYLTMMVDECAKFYYSCEEAHQRALNEEFKCYERCNVLVTYKNSAMLAINRLRKERQEREAAGLDAILPGEATAPNKDSVDARTFYNNVAEHLLSDDELVQHGFPRESCTPGQAVVNAKRKLVTRCLTENDRICARCMKHYQVDDAGLVLYEEECLYHPLKKRTFRGESIFLCCKSSDDSGCVTSNTHVSDCENDWDGYQVTMDVEENDPRSHEVYALDCEMCYTTRGLELTRVTIVNSECKTVYETLVKPLNPIIDYNTRFSGITKEQMERTATSILQVQANILHLCNAKTILIGHSLESDMKALKIIHSSIVDTSVMFPHKFGLPHKRALRDLAREYLKKIIQNDLGGHDSAEDALTCMELVRWKVKEESKLR